MWKYYRVKIHNLSNKQIEFIKKLSDIYRFSYNWGVNLHQSAYENDHKTISFIEMCTAFTAFRNTPGHEWLLDADINTCRYALQDVKEAYHKFFTVYHIRHPKFKTKKKSKIGFKVRSDRLRFIGTKGRYVVIPGFTRIDGVSSNERFVDLKRHNIPFGPGVKYDNVHIKHDGVDYWLSLSIKVPDPEFPEDYYDDCTEPLGIDVGLRTSAYLSNGMSFDRPDKRRIDLLTKRADTLRTHIFKDIKRRACEAGRMKTKYEKIPKSNNEMKRERKFRKTLNTIYNIYDTHYHNIAKKIVEMKPRYVVIEPPITHNLIRRKDFASKAVQQGKLALLMHDIQYKCENAGIPVYRAHSGFKSSQICSNCGNEYDPGVNKYYRCPHCGLVINRDYNAALNLLHFGERVVANDSLT